MSHSQTFNDGFFFTFFTVIAMFVIGFLLAVYMFSGPAQTTVKAAQSVVQGYKEIQKQAVELGYAEWLVDSEGNTQWQWIQPQVSDTLE